MAFRKILMLAAALTLGAIVAYSGSAQAHMAYHYGWHYGWHKGWHKNVHYRPVGYYGSCYQKQWVWTGAGYRWQWANTCDTGLFGAGLGIF